MSADSSQITADKPCLPPFSKKEEKFLLEDLLRDVSRSFYLTLRILPKEIRPQISLAYLLARASDTIADTKVVPRAKRIASLRQMQTLTRVPDLGDLVAHQSLPAEKVLLERLGDCFDSLNGFEEADCRHIQNLLQVIIGGQIFDLERFPGESERELVALKDDEELDRYTYMVAGYVGEFWTKMCRAHLKELEFWNGGAMEELGVRFGKGLQLVNVLRDIPKDLRIGRCYLPVKDPRALLDPANYDSIRAEYASWLDRAVEHLDAGWHYTMQIPSSLRRLRLACIWPIWIGLKTIAQLRTGNPLDPMHRIKISLGEVYTVMARSFLMVCNDAALDRAFRKLRKGASTATKVAS
jgi:farnesyl-diphosphate farnesyltransferase